jgi:hypothetical protein
MKSAYNSSHVGYLPVRVLQHNIVHQFENSTPDFPAISKQVIEELGLNHEISYHINVDSNHGCPVMTPCVEIETNTIHLQESFLAYMWCMCYALFRYTNNLKGQGANDNYHDEGIDDAYELLMYAQKLSNKYTDWDKQKLINPERPRAQDKESIGTVNEIFIYAINFILCHEFAHVELAHTRNLKSCKDINDFEKKEYELNADHRAIQIMSQDTIIGKKNVLQSGVTMAVCANLFLRDTVANKIHPDNDVRIFNVIDHLGVSENDDPWIIACVSMDLWTKIYGKSICMQKTNSFKKLYKDMSEQIIL